MTGEVQTLDNVAECKRTIMLDLARDETIFRLIDNQNVEYEYYDDLIGESIFPYLKVDYTIQTSGTFIGIKFATPNRHKNVLFKNTEITFLIVSSNNCVLMPDGNSRTDLIGDRIIEMYNWNSVFGFPIELTHEDEDPLNTEFYYRELRFTSCAPNSMVNGQKVNS